MKDDCPKCGKWMMFPLSHKCPPAWDCWDTDNSSEDSAKKIFASDAQEAAEKYSEWDDSSSAEYPSEKNVFVRAHDTTEAPIEFIVYLEARPEYTAHEQKAPK